MDETPSAEVSTPQSPKRSMATIIAVVIIVLLIVGGVILYGTNKFKKSTTNTAAPEASKQVPEGAKAQGMEIRVSAKNFSYTPTSLVVKKGQKVTLILQNTEGNHDFVIKEMNIKTPVIASGKDAKVTFTPDKVGTFEYYCSVGNHRAMGMSGTITVMK